MQRLENIKFYLIPECEVFNIFPQFGDFDTLDCLESPKDVPEDARVKSIDYSVIHQGFVVQIYHPSFPKHDFASTPKVIYMDVQRKIVPRFNRCCTFPGNQYEKDENWWCRICGKVLHHSAQRYLLDQARRDGNDERSATDPAIS